MKITLDKLRTALKNLMEGAPNEGIVRTVAKGVKGKTVYPASGSGGRMAITKTLTPDELRKTMMGL